MTLLGRINFIEAGRLPVAHCVVALIVSWLLGAAALQAVAAPVNPIGESANQSIRVQLLGGLSETASASEIFEDWEGLAGDDRVAGLSEGYVKGATWLRLTLQRDGGLPSRWWLVLSNPLLDRIDVYVRNRAGDIQHLMGGEEVPSDRLAAATVLPSFPLNLSEGESRVLVRIETRNSLAFRIALRDEEAMSRHEQRQLFQGGLIAGTHLLAAIAGFAIGWILRERLWFLYASFVSLSGLILLFLLGLPALTPLRALPGLGDKVHGVALILGVAAVIEFSARLSRVHLDHPRAYRGLALTAWAISLPACLCVLAGFFAETILNVQVLVLVVVPLILVGLWRQWRRGIDSAGYYLIGVGTYLVVSDLRALRNLGVLPSAWWTEGLQEMSSIGYLLVLAVGIASHSARALAEREVLETELNSERLARTSERDFLAMLSHELRTPLATIEASARVLRDVTALDPASRLLRHDKIERAVARLRDLFDRILASDRVRTDWRLANVGEHDLRDVLADALEAVGADRSPMNIVVTGAQVSARVPCDRNLLSIAIGNLVANALAYGPALSGIEIRLHPCPRGWRVEVADSGESIALDEREALFSPYVRGSRTGTIAGAGLGLFIVRRIARLHRGEAGLDVRADGTGNVFWIEVPGLTGSFAML